MGAVLVHIDLDGDRPHPSSMAALAAGRAVASSWGATLYAAFVASDPTERSNPGIAGIQAAIARAGADKCVVAVTDAPLVPLWSAIGAAWQSVLDHLRPRLVLFGADAPSAAELGPRTGARIGARLLLRARATAGDHVELRDRDGGYVRASDGGAAVVLVGATRAVPGGADDDIDLVVLDAPGGADPRIELAGSAPGELAHTASALVAIGDEVAHDPEIARSAARLARAIGAHVVGSAVAAKAGAVAPGAVLAPRAAIAPELCVAIGAPSLDLAGATALVRIDKGDKPDKGSAKLVEGALSGPIAASLDELVRALEDVQ